VAEHGSEPLESTLIVSIVVSKGHLIFLKYIVCSDKVKLQAD